MRRGALALVALGGAMGIAACGNILGLKDLEPYPSEGGAGDDVAEGSSGDSPGTGDDGPSADAKEGATGGDAREEDSTPGGDVTADVPMNDVVTMDVPPVDSGGCEGGEVLCGGQCTDLTSSQHHCGGCTHDCLDGQCLSSTCQAYLFANGVAHDMVIANGTLYWVDEGSAGTGAVWSCPTSNPACGVPTKLVTGQNVPTRITYDGSSCLYWTNQGGGSAGSIGSLKIGASACLGPFTSGVVAPLGIAADPTYVFWTDPGASPNQVVRASTGVVSPLSLQSSGELPAGIAILGANVYWGDYSTNRVDYSALGTLSDKNLTTTTAPWAFAVSGASLYWVDYTPSPNGAILATNGGSPTTIIGGQDSPIRVAADANVIYWINQGSMTASSGALWKCNPASCAPTNPIKNQIAQPEGLALDATDVFFSATGTSQIYRVVR